MGSRVNCPACGYFDKDTMFPHPRFGMYISDDERDAALGRERGDARGPRMYVCQCTRAVWVEVEALTGGAVEPIESGGVWFLRPPSS